MPQNASALRPWTVGLSASPHVAIRKLSSLQSSKTPWSTAVKRPGRLCATSRKPTSTKRTLARSSKLQPIRPRNRVLFSLSLRLLEQNVHERPPAYSRFRLGFARYRCRHHHSRRAGDLFFHARQRHGRDAMEATYVARRRCRRHVHYFAH